MSRQKSIEHEEREIIKLLHNVLERLATVEESLVILLQRTAPKPEPTSITLKQNS